MFIFSVRFVILFFCEIIFGNVFWGGNNYGFILWICLMLILIEF